MTDHTKTLQYETSGIPLRLVVLADDMTGALDTGVQFAKRGASVALIMPGEDRLPNDVQVAVVNAETRHLLPEEAYQRIRDLSVMAVQTGAPYLYVKTDSGMRGNIGPSLSGALEASGAAAAVFAPAYPAMNRTTQNGCQLIDGTPIARSVFGQDPVNPVRHSRVRNIIAWRDLQIQEVSAGKPLPEISRPAVCVMDAETDADLSRIAEELRHKGRLTLTAGCAAFSQALIPQMGLPNRQATVPEVIPPLLVVCGSLNPITHRQLAYGVRQGAWLGTVQSQQLLEGDDCMPLLQAAAAQMLTGRNVLIETDGSGIGNDPIRTAQRIASRMGELVQRLMAMPQSRAHTLMIIGGDTLMGYLSRVNPGDLRIEGEVAPGVVVFSFTDGTRRIRMLSKSGGFGPETLLSDVVSDTKTAAVRS